MSTAVGIAWIYTIAAWWIGYALGHGWAVNRAVFAIGAATAGAATAAILFWRRYARRRDKDHATEPAALPEPRVLHRINPPVRLQVLAALAILERDPRWEWAYWTTGVPPVATMIALIPRLFF